MPLRSLVERVAAGADQVVRGLRVADTIDIALVALAIFGLLSWLRRWASPVAARRAFVLSSLLVLGYIVTRTFELLLVRRLVEALAVVALVALVVVLQDELRRFLNQLGRWGSFGFRVAAPASSIVDELAASVGHLADHRIGALIALKGREPWDEHLQGGIELDGRMSQPLFFSVFNPDTPGHDGAVLVEDARITRFAVHLPMPRELPEASRYGGTRHAAAVGLTERCDALAVATLAWLVFAYSPNSILRTAQVSVDVRNVPDEWILERVEPVQVALALSGPERAFDTLDRDSLAIPLDFDTLQEGSNELTIDGGSVELPTFDSREPIRLA